MREVIVVADASYCADNELGGIGWLIAVDGEIVTRGGRPIFHDCKNIQNLELVALREALQSSRRYRRCTMWGRVRTVVITDNVDAFINIPYSSRMHKREFFTKYLLKSLPKRYKFTHKYHKECDEIANGMMNIARSYIK